MSEQKIYTKEQLLDALKAIRQIGWVKNARPGNAGGVGNTLEDLLDIKENNLPIPNAAEWELKCQRSTTKSLTTLFHSEPSPTALKFVPNILLPKYGWPHKKAGKTHPIGEMSFRQTISGHERSDRGFTVIIDKIAKKIVISFDSNAVSKKHAQWLETVAKQVGLGELNPQPYWGFEDIYHKAGAKLHNTIYVIADVKKQGGNEYFHYSKIYILSQFSIEGWLKAIQDGYLYVDFDARTGHNHGTKFRLTQNQLPLLYGKIDEI